MKENYNIENNSCFKEHIIYQPSFTMSTFSKLLQMVVILLKFRDLFREQRNT